MRAVWCVRRRRVDSSSRHSPAFFTPETLGLVAFLAEAAFLAGVAFLALDGVPCEGVVGGVAAG